MAYTTRSRYGCFMCGRQTRRWGASAAVFMPTAQGGYWTGATACARCTVQWGSDLGKNLRGIHEEYLAPVVCKSAEEVREHLSETRMVSPAWRQLADYGHDWLVANQRGVWARILTAEHTANPNLRGSGLMVLARTSHQLGDKDLSLSFWLSRQELALLGLEGLLRLTPAELEDRLLRDDGLVRRIALVLPDIPGLGGFSAPAEAQGGSHASPRPHARRGHWRRTPSGGRTWVRAARVGEQEEPRRCGQCRHRHGTRCEIARAWVGARTQSGLCPHWLERAQVETQVDRPRMTRARAAPRLGSRVLGQRIEEPLRGVSR